jgi:hypothetical protein
LKAEKDSFSHYLLNHSALVDVFEEHWKMRLLLRYNLTDFSLDLFRAVEKTERLPSMS